MFNVKKFTAFIAFNNDLRNIYFDLIEARGIESSWDVYHIQEGSESPHPIEIEIMEEIYLNNIAPDPQLRTDYESADINFRENVRRSIEQRKGK